MRIVVDAFGSDSCPGPDVAGAVMAARAWKDEIILVGPEERTRQSWRNMTCLTSAFASCTRLTS